MFFKKTAAVIIGLAMAATLSAATLVIDEQLPAGEYILTPIVAPPVDSDADGVPDDVDDCPDEYGTEPDGCPLPPVDTDGDGLPDDIDTCPTEPAQTEDGCPLPPPVSGYEMLDAIRAAAPEQHATEIRFKKIPGSEAPLSIFPTLAEFPFCDDIDCHNAPDAFGAYGGGAWNLTDWQYINPAGGGHSTTQVNAAYMAQLLVENGELAVQWSRIIDPSPKVGPGACGPTVSGPQAQHLYAGPVHVQSRNEIYMPAWSEMWEFSPPSCTLALQQEFKDRAGSYTVNQKPDGAWEYQRHTGPDSGFVYPRTCYLSNLDKIFISGSRMVDPANNYASTFIWRPNEIGGWWSTSGPFDSAPDPSKSRCYTYVGGLGVIGIDYTASGKSTFSWQSESLDFLMPSLSVEPISKDLIIVGVEGYARHIDVETKAETDISATAGEVIPTTNVPYLYGKVDMIPGADCVGIGLNIGQQGIYLFTLPANVCTQSTVVAPPTEPTEPTDPVQPLLVEAMSFPGCEGYGCGTPGGRGGKVIPVTTLNWKGPGSLSEALLQTGPRIIVFHVSGVIDVDREVSLTAENSFVTVAGQTSPGGITLAGATGVFLVSYRAGFTDAVFRHIRIRGNAGDTIQFNTVRNIVLDHVDLSGAKDETLDITGGENITVQWSTIANSDTINGSGYGALLAYAPNANITIHHNLFAHHRNRCLPHMHWAGPATTPDNGVLEISNNVVYNCAFDGVAYVPGPTMGENYGINLIGNFIKQGPDSPNQYAYIMPPDSVVYEAGTHTPAGIWSAYSNHKTSDFYIGDMPVATQTAEEAYDAVLAKVGAWPRDPMNLRTLREVTEGTGTLGKIDDPLLVYESQPATPVDSDRDGMPDAWETAHGLDAHSADDGSADRDSDGYTNVEEYLNELADLRVVA